MEVSLLRPVDPESADDALPLSDQFQTAQESTRKQDRLDVVTLEDRPDGIFVLFHEAKHFSNALNLLARIPPNDLLPESDGLTAGRFGEIIRELIAVEQPS